MKKKPLYKHLYAQVLFAIACGILLGYLLSRHRRGDEAARRRVHQADQDDHRADHLLHRRHRHRRHGGHEEGRARRRQGAALLRGRHHARAGHRPGRRQHRCSPGVGFNVDVAKLDTKAIARYTTAAQVAEHRRLPDEHHPEHASSTPSPRAKSCRCCSSAILFGFALSASRARRASRWSSFIDQFVARRCSASSASSCELAPIGAFGAMAFTIGKYGIGSLLPLGKLMGCFYLTCLLFIFVVLGLIARWAGFSIFRFIALHQGGAADRARHVVVRSRCCRA